ncbi:hypothetical protein D9M73_198960 [compost metagenome]
MHQQGQVIFTGVPRGLEAVDRDDVGAIALGREGMAHRGAFVNDLDAVFLEMRDHRRRVVAGGFDHLHATLDDGVHPGAVVDILDGHRQGQVDAKRLVGELTGPLDLGAQVIRRRLRACRHHTECSGVGNGCRQLRATNPLHATFNDWIVDAQQFGDSGFHEQPLSEVSFKAASTPHWVAQAYAREACKPPPLSGW